MNPYLTFALLFTLALLQSTTMPRITVLGVHPDLVLMVVTSWSLLRGSEEGMLWALLSGVAMDLFSGAPFGICTLPLLIVGFMCGLGQSSVFRFDLLIPMLVIPLVTLLYHGITLALLSILGWPPHWGTQFTRVVLPSMLVNTLGMPVVYLLTRMLHNRTRPKEISW